MVRTEAEVVVVMAADARVALALGQVPANTSVFMTAPRSRKYYYLHVTDEETGQQGGQDHGETSLLPTAETPVSS